MRLCSAQLVFTVYYTINDDSESIMFHCQSGPISGSFSDWSESESESGILSSSATFSRKVVGDENTQGGSEPAQTASSGLVLPAAVNPTWHCSILWLAPESCPLIQPTRGR